VLLPPYPVNKCIILYGNMNIREVRTPFLNPVSEQHIRKDKLHCEFRVVMSVTISVKKRCSVRLYLQLFVGGRMSYLRFLVFVCV
jgi:hypothetical protein